MMRFDGIRGMMLGLAAGLLLVLPGCEGGSGTAEKPPARAGSPAAGSPAPGGEGGTAKAP